MPNILSKQLKKKNNVKRDKKKQRKQKPENICLQNEIHILIQT